MRSGWLGGRARFQVEALDNVSPLPRPGALLVKTRAGEVIAGESEFTVSAQADTTDVLVHATVRPGRAGRMPPTVTASVVLKTQGPPLSREWKIYSVPLLELERTRIVRGRVPEGFSAQP